MAKRISATDAKNNFGGLLEDVTALGRVDIVRHGRVVAVVLAPRNVPAASEAASSDADGEPEKRRRTHMIPAPLARAARRIGRPADFDDGRD